MMKWELKLVALDQVTEWMKNPRIMRDIRQKQLEACITKFGLIDRPILNGDLTVIGGHQRLRLLLKQGQKSVECWVCDQVLSERDCEELALSLNKKTGEWDWDKLANEFDIDSLLASGFEAKDFEGKTVSEVKPKVTFDFDCQENLDAATDLIMELSNRLNGCKVRIKNGRATD